MTAELSTWFKGPLVGSPTRLLPDLTRSESLAIQPDPQHWAFERGLTGEPRRVTNGLYDGEIAALNRRLGTFFDGLATRGELHDSLIVVTADHGKSLLASPGYAIGRHRYFGGSVSQLRSRQAVFGDTKYRGRLDPGR